METANTVLSRSRLGRATLGLAALVLIGIVGFSYGEWRQYRRANVEAARTRRIEDAIDTLLFSLVDAEAAQRGYLLTGDPYYLQPYDQAAKAVPDNLAHLISALVPRQQDESANMAHLSALINAKLSQLRQDIELRRTQGLQPALQLFLSDQSRHVTREIRATGAAIQHHEISLQAQASWEGEAAAETALLATVAAALALLFLLTCGLEPFSVSDPQIQKRSAILRYGTAVAAIAAAFALRLALTPLIGDTELALGIYLPAILFAAWYGGLTAGTVALAMAALCADFFFTEPLGSFWLSRRSDQIAMLIFVVLGFGMALLADSQRRAVGRALRAESAERAERQRFETTLGSIGDAVVATDEVGRVTFVNKVGLNLMRAPEKELLCRQLDEVFHIVNEFTREIVESPVSKVLRENKVVGLANHTVLIACDGTEIPIDDSAAPIRTEGGKMLGTVLVFRDISARRAADKAQRESQLSSHLLRIQDEERRRIGRELHDSAGQNLVMLKMHLDSLESSGPQGETWRRKLDQCIRLADETIQEVRTTSYALYPPMLEDVGLKSAIPWFLDGFRERSGITTKLEIPRDFARPPLDVELALFRVLQESLTNILRHSQSSVARIRVEAHDGMLRLEVADEGKGMPPEVLEALRDESLGKLGVGLRGMRERLRQLGGKLDISSSAGGTVIRAAVGWAKPNGEQC